MRHRREENYEILNRWIDKHKDSRIIIGGDFNGRTANGGGL